MPQSLAKIAVHIVYSTKNRQPWLTDKSMRSELYAYNARVLENDADSPAISINGVEDHIHILCWLSRKFAIKDVLQKSKTDTTKWIKKQGPRYADCHWQSGYGAFSVSVSMIPEVKRYIANQEEHHKRFSFQDEFRELCRRHGVEIDERHVWD